MAEITWIKLRTNMFDDEKIKLIEGMPEGDSVLIVWIKLLSYAGKANCNGFIMINENIPMNIQQIAIVFNRPYEKIKYAISVLQNFGMIDINEEEIIYITNWEKHQNIEGMEKVRIQNAERQRRLREKKKMLSLENNSNVTRNVTVTLSNGTDIDIDKEKDINNNMVIKNDRVEEEFEKVWSFYPKKKGKQNSLKKFKTAVKKHGLEKVLEGTFGYIKVCELNRTDVKYIKQYDTFLNQETYLDDMKEYLQTNTNNVKLNPWEEDIYGAETNSSFDENNSYKLPTSIKQIGF